MKRRDEGKLWWAAKRTARLAFRCAIGAQCVLVVSGCSSSESASSRKIERIVLISIDTLRADALHSYGNPRNASPNMDRLASRGVRFSNVVAPAPMTLPSHATLLTGLHPLQHGVVVNGLDALPDSVETLAEMLSAAGWTTGAVVSSSVMRRKWGLARGFATYRDDLFSWMSDGGSFKESVPADRVTDAAIEWLGAHAADVPFFLFLHYIDPHSPYVAPRPYAGRFPEDPYLAEVAFVDSQVGRLVDFLEAENLSEETLWIVTSDHGEGLGDHGVNSHGIFLYEEITSVPLILSGAGVPKGRVEDLPVGLIDVVPTVLGLLDIQNDSALPGLNLRGVLPLDRSLVSVSYLPSLVNNWSPLWSLRNREEKFVLAPEREYYRIDEDPGELENSAVQSEERADALEAELRSRAARYIEDYTEPKSPSLDEVQAAELMALGYVVPELSFSSASYDDFSGMDPKRMLDVVTMIEDFHRARYAKNFDEAMRLLSEVRRLDPGNPMLDALESRLLFETERYSDLIEWYAQKPSELSEQNVHRHRRAVALEHEGRLSEAVEMLRRAVADDPDATASRYQLARQLLKAREFKEAAVHFEGVLAKDPRNRRARLDWANVLTRLGRNAEALRELEFLATDDKNNPSVYNNLGIVYAKIGRYGEAISMLQRSEFLKNDPSSRLQTDRMIRKLRALEAEARDGVSPGSRSADYPSGAPGNE